MKSMMIRVFLLLLGDHEKAGRVKRYLGSVYLKFFPGQVTCREFESFIIDYVEGELSDRQRKMFDWHMVICPMCKVHFETYRKAIELGQKVFEEESDEVPESVHSELVNAVIASRHSS